MKKLKDILKESNVQIGKVYSNPYAKSFVKEEEEERPQAEELTTEQKQAFLEAVKQYKKYGEAVYRNAGLGEVYESIKNMVEMAGKVTLSETDDWFDNVTVSRHMKRMGESFKVFEKTLKEVSTLQQRLEASYDEIGEVLGKYYEINETEEVEEGNEFGAARAKAIANGDDSFEVDGKKYPVKDVDKDDKENAKEFTKESMKLTDMISVNEGRKSKDGVGVRFVEAVYSNVYAIEDLIVNEKKDPKEVIPTMGPVLLNAINACLKHNYKPNPKPAFTLKRDLERWGDISNQERINIFKKSLMELKKVVEALIKRPSKAGVKKLILAHRDWWNYNYGSNIALNGEGAHHNTIIESVNEASEEFVVYVEKDNGRKKLLHTKQSQRAANMFLTKNADKILNQSGVRSIGSMSKDQWEKTEAQYAENIKKTDMKTVTKKEWDAKHNDYKGMIKGKPYMMWFDKKTQSTVYGPVNIKESVVNEGLTPFKTSVKDGNMKELITKYKEYQKSGDIHKRREVYKELIKLGNKFNFKRDDWKTTGRVSGAGEKAFAPKYIKFYSESINEAKYDIGMARKGNGITVYNRAEEEKGDYKNIAHISDNGVVKYYDKKLPKDVKKKIEAEAQKMKESINEGTKMIKLKNLLNESFGMGELPSSKLMKMKVSPSEMLDSVNEGVSAKKLLQSVVKGETSRVEGIKLSKEMAQSFLNWQRLSPFGKKYGKLPFHKLFTAAFNWGLHRYADKDSKEFKELKAKAKSMKDK